jgi:hypothetical protein
MKLAHTIKIRLNIIAQILDIVNFVQFLRSGLRKSHASKLCRFPFLTLSP